VATSNYVLHRLCFQIVRDRAGAIAALIDGWLAFFGHIGSRAWLHSSGDHRIDYLFTDNGRVCISESFAADLPKAALAEIIGAFGESGRGCAALAKVCASK
jgi:hypothetical protein